MEKLTREGLYYSEEHDWIEIDDGIATIGITDYAQESLGDIVYVELPEVGDEFQVGDAFAVLESVKAAVDVDCPVSGEVIEINEDLETSPELLNEAPYDNFICKLKLSEEPTDLLDEEEYKSFLETLEK